MDASSEVAGVLRKLAVGAEPQPGGGAHFRVWAPRRTRVNLVVLRQELQGREQVQRLRAEERGYFSGFVPEARPGDRYWLTLDDDPRRYPDPASRFQPEGPHGPSEVIDAESFRWTDTAWRGVRLEGQVLYEVHVGAYTPEGTFEALARELPEIARAGLTVIEIMPVADFPGRFGWGYDGVCLYAPTRLYGRPDDFRRLVDRAHALGLGVILDVVYNHLGPDGNFVREFSDTFFTNRYANEWGEAINFDGRGSEGVREFVIQNAGYWIDEFHLDGLRLDAVQAMHDRSGSHVLADIGRQARNRARGRGVIVVAENEAQRAEVARPVEQGGYGLEGLWNDDFHHSAVVALTGPRGAYYTDYLGTPGEFVAMARRGFLYQGQYWSWLRKPRGSSTRGLPHSAFVTFLENHDQVANSADGARLRQQTDAGEYRAMTAFLLLGPNTPMLFQGQEFGSTSPFLFFADHNPELVQAVRKGRADFLSQFPNLKTEQARSRLPPPDDPRTFERCKLDLRERERNAEIYAMHQDLLALRRNDPVFGGARDVDAAVLRDRSFVLRFENQTKSERLLIVNLGDELRMDIVDEPLLAAPEGCRWRLIWSSDDVRYGGRGAQVENQTGWALPARTALAFAPETGQ